MIKTIYKIELQIDDESFNLVVREPNFKEKKQLEIKASEHKPLLEKIENLAKKESEINARLGEIAALIDTNNEILRASNLGDKVKLLLENKAFISERASLKNELLSLNESADLINELDEKLEELFKFKSQMLLSGQIERLNLAMNEKNISHKLLWEHLNLEISKAQEKK